MVLNCYCTCYNLTYTATLTQGWDTWNLYNCDTLGFDPMCFKKKTDNYRILKGLQCMMFRVYWKMIVLCLYWVARSPHSRKGSGSKPVWWLTEAFLYWKTCMGFQSEICILGWFLKIALRYDWMVAWLCVSLVIDVRPGHFLGGDVFFWPGSVFRYNRYRDINNRMNEMNLFLNVFHFTHPCRSIFWHTCEILSKINTF